MVDMPDEQSIVTYVAQFLERFPELEPVRLFPFTSQTGHFSWGLKGQTQQPGLWLGLWLGLCGSIWLMLTM